MAQKFNAPLIVIGLGGTGSRIAWEIKKSFNSRFDLAPDSDCPPNTRFLVFDTAKRDQDPVNDVWTEDEFYAIDGDFQRLKTNLKPWQKVWFDPDFTDDDRLLVAGSGAGVFRQISRLFLSEHIPEVRTKINIAVNSVMQGSPTEPGDRKLRVFVCAGLAGGTGSGTFMDMAYILRKELGNHPYDMTLITWMPSVTLLEHHTHEETYQRLYKANGYAALKELDFWMAYSTHKHKYKVQLSRDYTVEWNEKPYDDVVIVGSERIDNAIIEEVPKHNLRMICDFITGEFMGHSDLKSLKKDTSGSLQTNSEGAAKSSFLSVKMNNLAVINDKIKTYPSPYAYTTIGAYSTSADQDDVLSAEKRLVIDETARVIHYGEVKDANGLLVTSENRQPDMSGRDKNEIAEKLIEKIGDDSRKSDTRKEYNERHRTDETTMGIDEELTFKVICDSDLNSLPHGGRYRTYETTLREALISDKRKLAEMCIQHAEEYIGEVIKNYEKGPQYAYDMLTQVPNGIIKQLAAKKGVVQSKRDMAHNTMNALVDGDRSLSRLAKDTQGTNALFHPLKATANVKEYTSCIVELYRSTQAYYYYEALLDAYEKLGTYLDKYKALLGDMINHISTLCEEMKQEEERRRANQGSLSLLDAAKVKGTLISAFNANQMNKQLVDCAFNAIESAITESIASGKETFEHKKVMELLDARLSSTSNVCFRYFNTLGIETKITNYSDRPVSNLADYVDTVLMDKLMTAAQPMFSFANDEDKNIAVKSYMAAIPADATAIYTGIQRYMQRTEGNYTALAQNANEEISWINIMYGMPLATYAGLADYKTKYDAVKNNHKCIHLCMGDDYGLNNEIYQNWEKLPEPVCPRTQVGSDEDEMAHSLIGKELQLNVTWHNNGINIEPNVTARIEYLAPIIPQSQAVTVEQVANKIKEIENNINNNTQRIAELNRLLTNKLVINEDTTGFADKLIPWGQILGNSSLLNEGISVDTGAARKAQIEKAYADCYERIFVERIQRKPALMEQLFVDRECMQLIEEKMAKWNRPDPEALAKHAEMFGKMVRYGVIKLDYAYMVAKYDVRNIMEAQIFDVMDTAAIKDMKRKFPTAEEFDLFLDAMLYYSDVVCETDPREKLAQPANKLIDDARPEWYRFAEQSEKLDKLLCDEMDFLQQKIGTGVMKSDEYDLISAVIGAVKNENDKFLKLAKMQLANR